MRIFNRCSSSSLLVMLALACTPAPPPTPTPPGNTSIARAAIEAEIDRYSCAVWLPEAEVYEARFGDPRCTDPPGDDSPLATAVRVAIDDCAALVPLAAGAYDIAYAGLEAPGERSDAARDAIVRAAYRGDPHLGPAALDRSIHHLAGRGLACSDCPTPAPVSVEPLGWDAFVLHVSAYVWPVRLPGEDQTHIYVCSGHNGIEALGLAASPALVAGNLAAVALAEDERTQVAIADLSARNLEVAETHVALAELLASPEAVAVICRSLTQTAWFTGVAVRECGEN